MLTSDDQKASGEEFLQYFTRSHDRIFRFLCVLSPNRADADELFQETSLLLWRRWDEFDRSRPFVPWACGIAFNVYRNWRKKKANRDTFVSAEVLERLVTLRSENSAHFDRLYDALENCLEKIPTDERVLLQATYGEGMSIQSLAIQMNRSPNALYKLLTKLRRMLHDCVVRESRNRTTLSMGDVS